LEEARKYSTNDLIGKSQDWKRAVRAAFGIKVNRLQYGTSTPLGRYNGARSWDRGFLLRCSVRSLLPERIANIRFGAGKKKEKRKKE